MICTTYSSARSLEKVTRKSQVNQILIASLWDLYHALFGEVLGSTPWLFFFFWGPRVVPSLAVWCWQSSDKQNRKRLLCLFPVWNNERQWRGNRQSCTRPSALVFFGSVSQNWSRTGPNCKEGSHKPKLDMQNSQSLLLFFFPNKERLEFLGQASRRREQNWQTSRTTNGEARKYLLGKWQKRLQSASGYLNNPYKNSQTAPTTTHGRSNQQASAEMTPLRPQGAPNHCQLFFFLPQHAVVKARKAFSSDRWEKRKKRNEGYQSMYRLILSGVSKVYNLWSTVQEWLN